VSRAVAADIEAETGRRADGIIPNGFDPDFYPLSDRRQSASPFILCASNWLDRKRQDVVLDLAERMPTHAFVIAGGISPTEWVHRQVERAKRLPNVDVLGSIPRERLRDLMMEARILLHPSDYEGLPLSVVEAMATGLPVVAQPRSSMPEIVRDGENGWLLDAADLAGWKGRIAEVLSWADSERSTMAHTIRESVVARFAWPAIAGQYGEIYRESESKHST
jgi:glycosyltransferase involved in cell wall biosynthesis